ncbi:TadE/TadG family type IV pilus assembly protein [Silvibacterium sp.]|uniref:TadE/TadG family type IV pilus assembly protein n=1 Tax=Silvibacterium sp. TaxID=1964179 RepID=UPI0039E29066
MAIMSLSYSKPRPGLSWWVRRAGSDTGGSSLIEAALVMPALLFLLAGAADFGRAYSIANEVSAAAHAGALYGIHNLSDTAGMADAVTADASDLPGLTTTTTYGCECFDGTSVVAGCTTPPTTCTQNYVNYVKVTASDTYTPIFPYPGIPSSIVLQNTVILRSGGD